MLHVSSLCKARRRWLFGFKLILNFASCSRKWYYRSFDAGLIQATSGCLIQTAAVEKRFSMHAPSVSGLLRPYDTPPCACSSIRYYSHTAPGSHTSTWKCLRSLAALVARTPPGKYPLICVAPLKSFSKGLRRWVDILCVKRLVILYHCETHHCETLHSSSRWCCLHKKNRSDLSAQCTFTCPYARLIVVV